MASVSPPSRSVVLVVEDEALVRIHAATLIEEAGFDVVEAASADEAIGILEARRDIRIVFTDMHMPGTMDGLKLAHAVRGRWPPVHLVVTSGLATPGLNDLPERGVFLPKPYGGPELVRVLRGFHA